MYQLGVQKKNSLWAVTQFPWHTLIYHLIYLPLFIKSSGTSKSYVLNEAFGIIQSSFPIFSHSFCRGVHSNKILKLKGRNIRETVALVPQGVPGLTHHPSDHCHLSAAAPGRPSTASEPGACALSCPHWATYRAGKSPPASLSGPTAAGCEFLSCFLIKSETISCQSLPAASPHPF